MFLFQKPVAAVLVGAFFGFVQVSEAAGNAFYVEVNAGPSFAADSDLSAGFGLSATAKFDPGFNVGGAVGYRFLEDFRTELNFSYRQADVDKLEGGGALSGITLEGAGDVGAYGIMANGYFDWDLGFPIKPYVGVGIGVGIIDISSDSSALLRVDDDDVQFAYNAMAGLSFSATEHIVLSAGYRYFGTLDAEFDFTVPGLAFGTLDAEVGVHEVVVGIRYEF